MNPRPDNTQKGVGAPRLVRLFILLCMKDSNRGSHAPRIVAQGPNQCPHPGQNPLEAIRPNNMARTGHEVASIRLQEPARKSYIHSPRSPLSFARPHLLKSRQACHSLVVLLEGAAGRMCDPTNNLYHHVRL